MAVRSGIQENPRKQTLSRPAWRRHLLLCGAALLLSSQTEAAELQPPRTTYGSVGMIEMSSARFADDGEISMSISGFENTERMTLGFQALPWLETSFRYSGLNNFDPDYSVYYDRSFGAKLRLSREGEFMPAIALGINDVIGTGLYSSEYVVASKQFGNLDFSLGMGWGRLGSVGIKNPLTLLSSSLANRLTYPTLPGGNGTISNVYFHGPKAGLFGGVVWQTPLQDLSLIAEYSSDAYALEKARGNFSARNQINVGASYHVTNNITTAAHWVYGKAVGASVTIALNPTVPTYAGKIGPQPIVVNVRSEENQRSALQSLNQQRSSQAETSFIAPAFTDALFAENKDLEDIQLTGNSLRLTIAGAPARRCQPNADAAGRYGNAIRTVVISRARAPRDSVQCTVNTIGGLPNAAFVTGMPDQGQIRAATTRIHKDAKAQNIDIVALHIKTDEAIVYYSNGHYFAETTAIDRLLRILMADAPLTVEKFRLLSVNQGQAEREFDFMRSSLERDWTLEDSLLPESHNIALMAEYAPLDNPVLNRATSQSYPKFSWGLFPQVREGLFDPIRPLGIQFLATLGGSLEVLPGLTFNAGLEANIYQNITTGRLNDSVLPHVRSDLSDYIAQGANGISALDTEYRTRLAPNVFALFKAGYLESEFAGAGGEVLWRPEGQRWALGLDAYEVEKRNFDRLFGLQHYRAFTGHVSVYYQSPWYDINFVARAGQYLAGDRGLTLEITRRFSTGVEVGAFVTRTNVSAARFGEGSFDKGIIIRIPLDWMLPINTQSEIRMDMRPIQRDGGQRLLGDTTLFEATRRTSTGEMENE